MESDGLFSFFTAAGARRPQLATPPPAGHSSEPVAGTRRMTLMLSTLPSSPESASGRARDVSNSVTKNSMNATSASYIYTTSSYTIDAYCREDERAKASPEGDKR